MKFIAIHPALLCAAVTGMVGEKESTIAAAPPTVAVAENLPTATTFSTEQSHDRALQCAIVSAYHPNYSLPWNQGRCEFVTSCNSPGYSTELECCKRAYGGQVDNYCISHLGNPPTAQPTKVGGPDIFYPDYALAWPEGKCVNTLPVPSGWPTYTTMLACCKATYVGQMSGACIKALPNAPTVAPSKVGEGLYYPDYTLPWINGKCINTVPVPSGWPTYTTMLACCKAAYVGQMSGACIKALPNAPTGAPSKVGEGIYYPDYTLPWIDGKCINVGPVPSGWPTYTTMLACCKAAYVGQASRACISSSAALLQANSIAPTTIAPSLLPTSLTPTTFTPITSSPSLSPTSLEPTSSTPTTVAPSNSPTTLAPTTFAPSTSSPSLSPTSLAPTSSTPTTVAPSNSPTTLTPTTFAPSTSSPSLSPTSLAPTSSTPTTVAPSNSPTTLTPTTFAPSTSSPSLSPTSLAPTTSAPTTVAPSNSPTTLTPTTFSPSTAAPSNAPTSFAPTTAAPTTKAPSNSPTTLAPTTSSPTNTCFPNKATLESAVATYLNCIADNTPSAPQCMNLRNLWGWPIGTWCTSLITDMSYMLSFRNFNEDISLWNVGSVVNMIGLFRGALVFNQNISAWNVSSVTNMNSMFNMANAFNQNIAAWNVKLVTDMNYMFYNAYAFNQNISGWKVDSVTDMTAMFFGASSFNQNMCAWKNKIPYISNRDIFGYSKCTYKTTPTGLAGPFCAVNTCSA